MEIKHPAQDKIQRLRPTPRWSDATIFNGIAHFVEVPADTEQDMTSQTVQIFKQTECHGKGFHDTIRVKRKSMYSRCIC